MTDAKKQPPQEVPDAVRVRMQRWLASSGLRSYLEQAPDTGRRPNRTGPYIAISREAGSGGGDIARQVAQLLGWDLLDKELLDFIAQRYGMPRGMLDFVDETRANWLQDMLSGWFDARFVTHEKFVVCLERVVFLAGMYGKIVFVGRGVHRILPRASGLAVRLVAPLEFRIARLIEQGLTRQQAQRHIREIESHRDEFYRRYFHHECGDPHAFDLTINVARFTPVAVSEMIAQALDRLSCDTSPPADSTD